MDRGTSEKPVHVKIIPSSVKTAYFNIPCWCYFEYISNKHNTETYIKIPNNIIIIRLIEMSLDKRNGKKTRTNVSTANKATWGKLAKIVNRFTNTKMLRNSVFILEMKAWQCWEQMIKKSHCIPVNKNSRCVTASDVMMTSVESLNLSRLKSSTVKLLPAIPSWLSRFSRKTVRT